MLRASKVAGLTVVMHKTGKRLGAVERIVLREDGQDAQGLLIRTHGFVRRKRFVPYAAIALWGDKTVAVTGHEPLERSLARREDIVGAGVLETSGGRMGWVTDVLLEKETGRVNALEVSKGYLDDLTSGRICVRDFTLRPKGVVAAAETVCGEETPRTGGS